MMKFILTEDCEICGEKLAVSSSQLLSLALCFIPSERILDIILAVLITLMQNINICKS